MIEEGEPQELASAEGGSPSMIGLLAGTVIWYGDLISPIDEAWEADA